MAKQPEREIQAGPLTIEFPPGEPDKVIVHGAGECDECGSPAQMRVTLTAREFEKLRILAARFASA